MFNLAALIGLGAVVAGGITLHRRVVIFEGTVALWIAALAIAAAAGLITLAAALALALAVLAPYVYISAVRPSGRSALPLPPRLRSWLAGAVAKEEQELADAIHPAKGGPRDAAVAVLALAVVVTASAAMEGTASALGIRWAVPGVITASPGPGGALRTAIWYGVLTAATIALTLAGRGINRRSGTLIIAAYLVFAITVIVKALRRVLSSPALTWPAAPHYSGCTRRCLGQAQVLPGSLNLILRPGTSITGRHAAAAQVATRSAPRSAVEPTAPALLTWAGIPLSHPCRPKVQ